jgi:hypothetical protein
MSRTTNQRFEFGSGDTPPIMIIVTPVSGRAIAVLDGSDAASSLVRQHRVFSRAEGLTVK